MKKYIKPGDIVLVFSPDTPHGQWPLGRILEVYSIQERMVIYGQSDYRLAKNSIQGL